MGEAWTGAQEGNWPGGTAGKAPYRHLLRVVLAEGKQWTSGQTVRILDAGCGDGYLMAYLTHHLRQQRPDVKVELHGFEVSDFDEGQQVGENVAARERLGGALPDIEWQTRLRMFRSSDPWPYPDSAFDVVVSNQVLEHVGDHRAFLRELARVLKPEGFAAHVFPPKDSIMEVHWRVPLAHRISDRNRQEAWLRLLARMGSGQFRPTLAKYRSAGTVGAESIWLAAVEAADWLRDYTNYISCAELRDLCQEQRLSADFGYTLDLYRERFGGAKTEAQARGRWLFPLLKWGPLVSLVSRRMG